MAHSELNDLVRCAKIDDAYIPKVLKGLTGLIHYHAMRNMSKSSSLEYDDLCQEGRIAVVACIKRWDDTRGSHFWTFASRRIAGAMKDALRWTAEMIKTPRLARTRGEGSLRVARDSELQGRGTSEVALAGLTGKLDPRFDLVDLQDLVDSALKLAEPRLRLFIQGVMAGKRMKQMGQDMGLCESRVSQLYPDFMEKTRNLLERLNAV